MLALYVISSPLADKSLRAFDPMAFDRRSGQDKVKTTFNVLGGAMGCFGFDRRCYTADRGGNGADRRLRTLRVGPEPPTSGPKEKHLVQFHQRPDLCDYRPADIDVSRRNRNLIIIDVNLRRRQ